MPEATFLCIDTSEFTRNRDYGLTRLMGIIDASNLIAGGKLNSNPENTVGFLTMGGKHCVVHESLTTDVDRMLASLSKVKTEGSLHLVEGLRIGSLALAHRANTKGEKRLIAFVASPVTVTEEVLVKLAKKLRKDEVAVDVVNIGAEDSIPLLQKFVETANKNNNSNFLHIPAPQSIPDAVVSSVILGGQGGGAGAGGGAYEFGVDPNLEPELVMALRLSAEEERMRQERAAGGPETRQAPVPAPAPAPVIPSEGDMDPDLLLALQLSREMEQQEQQQQQQQQQKPSVPPPVAPSTAGGEKQLTEAELMEKALKMSVEQEDADVAFDDIVNDEAFLANTAKEAGVDPSKVVPKKSDKDKEDKK